MTEASGLGPDGFGGMRLYMSPLRAPADSAASQWIQLELRACLADMRPKHRAGLRAPSLVAGLLRGVGARVEKGG